MALTLIMIYLFLNTRNGMYCKKKLLANSSGCSNTTAVANKSQNLQRLSIQHCDSLVRNQGQLVTLVSAAM